MYVHIQQKAKSKKKKKKNSNKKQHYFKVLMRLLNTHSHKPSIDEITKHTFT